MPRTAKRQAPQAPAGSSSAGGLPYGAQKDLIEAQKAMPLPSAPGVPSGSPTPPPAPSGEAAPGPATDPLTDALGMTPPGGSLADPTTSPTTPVTAGLDIGAGPGSSALNGLMTPPDPTARSLQILAEATGDQTILSLATRAASGGAQ